MATRSPKRTRVSTGESAFDALLDAGKPRSALEAALADFDAKRGRDPGRCVVRIHRIATELDARGTIARIPDLRERIERVYDRARLDVPASTEALWREREPTIGIAAFPVVVARIDGAIGALRWVKVEAGGAAARYSLASRSALTAIESARQLAASVFPDDAKTLNAARLTVGVHPDIVSNRLVDGDSLGVAAFAAFASYALRRPISPAFVFTGAIAPRGDLVAVDAATLATKRSALHELADARFLVAPGHPRVVLDHVAQIGETRTATELLALVLGPWWGPHSHGRAVWIDRSWREALRIDAFCVDFLYRGATFERDTRGVLRVAATFWQELSLQLRVTSEAWTHHFIEGASHDLGLAFASQATAPSVDAALSELGAPPHSGHASAPTDLGEARTRVRTAVLAHRAALERWLSEELTRCGAHS